MNGTLQEAINENRARLLDELKRGTPMKVALLLEKEGWSREWACKAVQTLEVKYNPAHLHDGSVKNQEIREKLQMRASIGAGLFILGTLVTVVTLLSALAHGGLIVIAFGAIFSGASLWGHNYSRLKKYPDRRLPIYLPPKDSTGSRPQDY